jgi:hypothetical protein
VKLSRRMLFASTIAPCAACVFARALSITKSWSMSVSSDCTSSTVVRPFARAEVVQIGWLGGLVRERLRGGLQNHTRHGGTVHRILLFWIHWLTTQADHVATLGVQDPDARL